MRIIWHGHSCFEVSDDIVVLIDPHDGRSIGIRPPRASPDVILVTHDHFDHNAVRVVQGPKTKIVDEPGSLTRHGIRFIGIPTFHDRLKGDDRGENIIYKFNIDGITFCHLGDIGEMVDHTKIREIGSVDILFVPAGGRFTLDPVEAWKLAEIIGPRVIVPMHYRIGGISLPLQPVSAFLAFADKVKNVGHEMDLVAEELPDETEVWVFSL